MKKNIISAFHHQFAGGSKSTSRLLHYLSQNGHTVDVFAFETPQYFTYTKSTVRTHILGMDNVNSEVIDKSLLKNYLFTEKIMSSLLKTDNPVLFGANLFPYCNILLDAKIQMQHQKNIATKLIVHPVGSDIWQVGSQMKSRVKWLLENPQVDSVITYSHTFIDEIKEYFDIDREMNVVPPVLEREIFYPLNELKISERRKLLGMNDDVFIMHHHSSMRKIKCPEIILDIAQKAAQGIADKCILVMTGPIPYDTISRLHLKSTKINDVFIYKTELRNLIVYWTGIISNVEYVMQISDVELNASLHDSFNLALMEAMACGIPVVTSDEVGIGNHIGKANGGVCFPVKKLKFDELNNVLKSGNSKNHLFDIDYAVSAIINIARNRVAARLDGQEAARYVSEEFSFDNVAREFYKYIM
ncbi:glycosyltransferase family 4 protein [Parasediminibacterium sp. JCM 36343]|uniref:glycosyltransferase family 4 protein n=1 Tax=Parasediminibacterium sp. JCM 36343 TaxID=3374279 RepID=UPI00397D023E